MASCCRCGHFVVLSVVVLLGPAGLSRAQDGEPDFWGTGTNIDFISAEEFSCSEGSSADFCHWTSGAYNYWYVAALTDATVYAPVNLPAGSLVQGYRVIYRDADPAEDIHAALKRGYYHLSNGPGEEVIETWDSSGTPGNSSAWVDVDPDITIAYRYENYFGPGYASYYFRVVLGASSARGLRGILVYWNRQISPAPATQTFPDVAPGFWAFQEIEALAASGITTGFPDGTYRPTEPVTRAQMATFLARALGLHWAP